MELVTAISIAAEDYHARNWLTHSQARKIRTTCPAIYRWERDHPADRPRSDTFDFGKVAHQMVLGDDGEKIDVYDFETWRTKAAIEAKRESHTNGRVPILRKDFDICDAMANAVRQHPLASRLLDPEHGKPEQTLAWEDEFLPVTRAARLDWLPEPVGGRLIVADYKTSRSADPLKFGRSASDFGYHTQADWYTEAIIANGLDEDPKFVFVVQEKTPPYVVTVCQLDDIALRVGAEDNRDAIQVFHRCVTTGEWPGYSDEIEVVGLPYWITNEYEDRMVV